MSGATGRIICIEGPSAAGKTSLAARLASEAGALTIEEVAGQPPDGDEPERWFVARHVEQWQRAVALAGSAEVVVLDGDPFKTLWYNWVFASDPGAAIVRAGKLYDAEVAQDRIRIPDLYILLRVTEAQLRERRAGDLTRSRRNFEKHLALVEPQRRYFAELSRVSPGRVLALDTVDRESLVHRALTALDRLPVASSDAGRLLNDMTIWLVRQIERPI